jgi:membrane protein
MGLTDTSRSVLSTFQEENVTFLGASVAFYVFTSIIPLLLLVVAIGSLVGGQAFADSIVSLVEGHLSNQGSTVVEEAMTSSTGRSGATVAGLVGLTWSALKIFRGFDLAFDEVYGSETETSLGRQIIDGLAVLASVSPAIVLMVGVGMLLRRPSLLNLPYVNVLGGVVLVIGLAVVFLPFYYVLPPVDVSVREALPGAIFASVGWLVLQAVFQVYASNAGRYQAYGFLGAVLLFVLWLYFASVLVLFGAVVNAVLADEA